VDPTALVPELTKSLEERIRSTRPSDPPRTLGYHMATAMHLSIWLFLLLLPVGAVVGIVSAVSPLIDWQVDPPIVRTMLLYIVTVIVFAFTYALATSIIGRIWDRVQLRKWTKIEKNVVQLHNEMMDNLEETGKMLSQERRLLQQIRRSHVEVQAIGDEAARRLKRVIREKKDIEVD